ncbi:MAG: amidoligase family protein [Myxococcota bacterium]|nr:amidoligase family protein [Myxococcota bacterium]
MEIRWRVGVEVELMAPPTRSRRDLAAHLAGPAGEVRPYFLPQSEPSQVSGLPSFHNLTLAFAAHDVDGNLIARCVDDLTLQADLDRSHAPEPGWFRVVSDDLRLLRLAQRHGRADAGIRGAVEGLAALFGVPLQEGAGGMLRVLDETGASVAIAAPLPGERHRPCELITPPIDADHTRRLATLLQPAARLGFTLPAESATHIHFDGAALKSATVLRNLVRLLEAWGDVLKRLVGTNPRCVRLGSWPDALRTCTEADDFTRLPWSMARQRLRTVKLSKYCDFNLLNLVRDTPEKCTFEVRILPGLMETAPIIAAAALFEAILRRTREPVTRIPVQPWEAVRVLLADLPLEAEARKHWEAQARR